MTRSMLTGAVLVVMAGAAPQASAQYSGVGDSILRCESTDGRQRFCQADTRDGIQLLRQLSKSACVEGDTWGADRRGVWVDRGCRAEFALGGDRGYPGDGYGNGNGNGYGDQLVRCESRDGRWKQCAADTRRGAELVRQLSDNACIRGRTWGTDNRGLWVSGGCRAEFRLRAGNGNGNGNGWGQGGWAPQLVQCESPNGRRRVCAVTVRGDVRLVRQMSKSACVEGDTWGFSRDGIWVDRGCRGEFQVTQRGGRRND